MNSSNTATQKLRFRIIECSSEEAQFPASELLTGSTQSKGWQSQRFCPYPQFITFQFLTPVNLKQVQFLCHEAKIPSKIELFIASPESLTALSHTEPTYKRLGHLDLESNEQSNFQLRELKTIFIDKPCLYLKIVFHKCYQNRLNFFNQVGLITMVAFGEQFGNFHYPPKNVLNLQNLPTTSAPMSRRDKTEPQTELDEVTMIKISELEEAKIRAVESEEFDEAQRLKAELNRLHQLGVQLRRLDEKKTLAIENEDYETAKAYKREIDRCREALTDAINNRRPRTNNYQPAPPTQNSFYPPLEKVLPPRNSVHDRSMNRTPSYQRPSLNRTDQEKSLRHDESYSILEEEKRGRVKEAYGDAYNYQRKGQANRSMPPSVLNFDEQVIPTLAKKSQGGGDEEMEEQESRAHIAEELSTPNQKLAAPLIPALGQELCKKLFSKHWDLREEAVQTVSIELSNPNSKIINTNDQWSLFVATLGVVSFTITDRVNQVATKAMNLLKVLLARKPPNPGAKNDFIVYVEVVLNGLLEKISDNNTRIREQSEEAILNMTKNPVFSCPFCLSVILKDNNTKSKTVQPAKNTIARLRLLQKIISIFKIDNQQIPYNPVIDFCLEKLENPNSEVRATVTGLLVDIYVLVGDRIKNDLTDVRPAQLEVLMREFDAVSKSSRVPAQEGPVNIKEAQPAQKGKKK